MSYAFEFEKEKPVVEFSFEELLKYLMPYIRGVTYKKFCLLKNHVSYQHEDFLQEASLVLWKCWQKYRNFSNLEFIKLYKCSLGNRIAEIMRVRESSRKQPEQPIDDVMDFGVSVNKNSNMVDSQFYDREIKRLVEKSSEKLGSKIMQRCQPTSKSTKVKLTREEESELGNKSIDG